jgi:hypothetical protein
MTEVFLFKYKSIVITKSQVWGGQVLTILDTHSGGISLREMAENGHLTNHWAVSPHFFCNDVCLLFII